VQDVVKHKNDNNYQKFKKSLKIGVDERLFLCLKIDIGNPVVLKKYE